MNIRWVILAFLTCATLLLASAYYAYPNYSLLKGVLTALALTASYFVFKLVLEERIISRIERSDRRYYLLKLASAGFILFIFVAASAIWVKDLQALLFGFGLVAAAFTISLQDVAKNFAGGSSIFLNGLYKVGDRVEIGSKRGDVIDIGILYTTIMETNEWVSGDQHTGRLSVIPNSYVLTSVLNNYTRDFNFLWDEITIPITYHSNWIRARSAILDIVRKEAESAKEIAEEEISTMERKYFVSRRSLETEVFMKLTDNWIELTARYVVPVTQRRIIRSRISQAILEGFEADKDVKIASQTLDIVGFPEMGIKKEEETAS
jgi:small-conductance mechanosensitive channel